MKIKKFPFVLSFALSTLFVVGTVGFADQPSQSENMMDNMMGNDGMGKMMEAMNSPEGQEMMQACSKFMDSYSSDNTDIEQASIVD